MLKFLKISLLLCMLLAAYTAARAENNRIELPMSLRGSQPVVDVMVNGQGPFKFAIDTGAQGKARADSSLVDKLKLPQVGEARGGDPSGRNPVTMAIVQMSSIKLGTLEFKDVDAPSRDYSRGPGAGMDGIFGLQLFADKLLTLDYGNKKIVIESGALDAKDENVMSFSAPRGVPIVKISVAGQIMDAHIDTGNMVAPFLVSAEAAAKLAFKSEPVVVGQARTVSNTFEIKSAPLKGDIVLGKQVYANPDVRFPSPGRDANVGSLALADKVVTIDQKNGLIRIAASANAAR